MHAVGSTCYGTGVVLLVIVEAVRKASAPLAHGCFDTLLGDSDLALDRTHDAGNMLALYPPKES